MVEMQPWCPPHWAKQRQNLQTRIAQEPQNVPLKQQLNSLTPLLGLLPEEILVEIVRFYVLSHKTKVEESEDLYTYGNSISLARWTDCPQFPESSLPEEAVWFRISHVCRHFRALVLHDPMLWADVLLYGEKWTERTLENLPANLPLTVRGAIDTDVEQIRRLFSHSAQIRTLDLCCSADLWRALSDVQEGYQFSVLHILKLSHHQTMRTLGRVPLPLASALSRVSSLARNFTLRDVSNLNPNLQVLKIIYYPTIRETNPIQFYHRLLRGLPNLELLELTVDVRRESNIIPSHVIILPRLRTLRLSLNHTNNYTQLLTPLQLPQCAAVHIRPRMAHEGWKDLAHALRSCLVLRDPFLTLHCDVIPNAYVPDYEGGVLRLRMWIEHITPPSLAHPSTPCVPDSRLTILIDACSLDPMGLWEIMLHLLLQEVRALAIYDVERVFEDTLWQDLRSVAQTPEHSFPLAKVYTKRWVVALRCMPHVEDLYMAGSICHILPKALNDCQGTLFPELKMLHIDKVRFIRHRGPRDVGDGETEYVSDEEENWPLVGEVSLEMLEDALKLRVKHGFKLKKLVLGLNVTRARNCAPVNNVLPGIRDAVDELVDNGLGADLSTYDWTNLRSHGGMQQFEPVYCLVIAMEPSPSFGL